VAVAIRVEGVSKRYRIEHGGREPYVALRDVLASAGRRMLNGLVGPLGGGLPAKTSEEFWALRDVSFEVNQGDRVGIIGRNGAGKSTMLKLLSRITEPTRGRISIKGRLASLLEVGTGFHPELTGRENIFLNGAILGMARGEIARKFDEIVAFSEVERFLDTPVKRYSSGMYVRLAFAVAAHLEPEILVVDEVLAVGDWQFQKKCLGKMQDVSTREGRTVIFVSHNMAAIKHLCTRALLLQAGELVAEGTPSQIVDRYQHGGETQVQIDGIIASLPPDPVVKLESVKVTQAGCGIDGAVQIGLPLEIRVRYRVLAEVTGLRVHFDLYDDQGTILIRSFHDELADGIPTMSPGEYVSHATIPAKLLGPTNYELGVGVSIFNVRLCVPAGSIRFPLRVEDTGDHNRAYPVEFRARLAPAIRWEVSSVQEEVR
jgi:lipopolysaccharide transport system ATP-binding protein